MSVCFPKIQVVVLGPVTGKSRASRSNVTVNIDLNGILGHSKVRS